jgi:hypothetical protein
MNNWFYISLGDGNTFAQIYEWNGQTGTNISNNPLSVNGGQSWRNDGYWTFMIPCSNSQSIHIRDAANRTILATDGYYRPAWSPNGLLMFCVHRPSGWILALCNGVKIIEIANGDPISAQWGNGEEVVWSVA